MYASTETSVLGGLFAGLIKQGDSSLRINDNR
jgi:hypothetical protein